MRSKNRTDAKESHEVPPGEGREPVEKDIEELLIQAQRAGDERDALRDQLMRTMADFQNYRRRQEEQRKLLEQFATERLVTALLPVLDNFERALSAMESGEGAGGAIEGLRAIDRQLRTVLESQKVNRIPAVGEHFDPEVHEALATETSEEHEDNTVIAELEAGYRMGDKVIRPARVRVARRP